MRRFSRAWWSWVPVVRRRRRLRCWLGLPMRALLDPVFREGVSSLESLSFDRERGVWCVPEWGRECGVWSSSFVVACRRSGVWKSSWWLEVPVSLQDLVGRWAIGPGVGESVDGAFADWVGMMTGGELVDLLAELEGSSSEVEREVCVACRRELARRK